MLGAPVDAPVALDERRGDLVAVGEGVHGGQQVVPVAHLEEIGADGLDGFGLVEGGAVDRLQVPPGDRRELLTEGGVAEGQFAQVQHEVVLEELDVLGELQLQEPLVREELVDPAVDLHAVREVGDLVAPVADGLRLRLVGDPPVVHPVGDEGDAAGGGVGLGGEEQVLVVDADREAQPLVEQEPSAVALVGRQGVEDQQVGQFGDRLQGPGAPVQPGVPLDLLAGARVDVHAHAQARDQVGAGGLGGLQHVAARVALQDVVAVEEEHVGAAGLGDAAVAGGAAAAAVLGQPAGADPVGVRRGQSPCHLVRAVGAPVVDDDHLDVVQRLVQDGADGRGQPGRVVVDDDDHGDGGLPRPGPGASGRGGRGLRPVLRGFCPALGWFCPAPGGFRPVSGGFCPLLGGRVRLIHIHPINRRHPGPLWGVIGRSSRVGTPTSGTPRSGTPRPGRSTGPWRCSSRAVRSSPGRGSRHRTARSPWRHRAH